jgi:hypothetical protein
MADPVLIWIRLNIVRPAELVKSRRIEMPSMELREFLQKVRDELKQAYEERPSKPMLALSAVDLEVSFTLSGKGNTKGKLLVVELEGEVGTERTHKVTLHLVPTTSASNATVPTTFERVEFSKGKYYLPIAHVNLLKKKGRIL